MGYETGNEITGIYTLTTQTTTDGYQVTETASFNDVTFTLTETGNDTVTASAPGNQVTGYIDQYDTVSDGYTMTETGTRTGGAFSEVVTGTETYQDQETGTPQQGNYSVYETGSGTFDRTDDGPGATLPSQFGTTGYTLTETYSSLRGGISQTTVSGGGPLFSPGSPGRTRRRPGFRAATGSAWRSINRIGAPVVTVSWWNSPLAADKGNPWGNGGDGALKDTDYSGEGGGDFGPPRSLTDKLLDPIQEAPDQGGFWEKASEWLPGVSTVRDLGGCG